MDQDASGSRDQHADQSRQPTSIDWTSTVVLGDGSTATIRPITGADAEALQHFHAEQSNESNYYRYFSPKPRLSDREVERFTVVDMRDRVALVVEQHGEFIAWASYERWERRPDAEVAFQVDDDHQGLGIATLLLEHLAAIARTNGINRFSAETLSENRGMISVFSKAGWPVQRRFDSGVVDVEFPLEDSADFQDSVDRREQRADSRAMARLLMPRSIAVVGASDEPNSIGNALWEHTSADDRVPVYPVNPNRDSVGGVKAFATVREIDAEIDLAVIAVRPSATAEVIDDCIAARVRGAVLVTSVADDAATSDHDHETALLGLIRHARRNGLRIIGPASMGIASPLPGASINTTLVNVTLRPGPIALSTQSGTLGASVLRLARDLNIGLSWFVSLGDKGDVSSNDLLQFWQDDQATQVICLYTESIGNPGKFVRIAQRVARERPVIVVRTGAASTGLGSDAMYRGSGVIEVPTVHAMLDTARVMVRRPLMHGDRVAVVSNARSPRIAAEAALTAVGLTPVNPPQQLDWRSDAADYRDALSQASASDDIDAIVVIHAPPTEYSTEAPNRAIAEATADAPMPVCAVMLGSGDGPLLAEEPDGIASFSFPEQAAAVLSRLRAYSIWRHGQAQRPATEPFGLRRQHAARLIDEALANGTDQSNPELVRDLLASYGITMPKTTLVNAEQAAEAATDIGFPVAVKAFERQAGSSVRAGIGLDLTDAEDVTAAVATMRDALGAGAAQVWVQAMVEPGFELRANATVDDLYGPIVSTGLGGFDADLIDDIASRTAPFAPSAARHLIAETKAGDALSASANHAMVDLLVRLALLVSDHPEVRLLDLNPIIVSNADAQVVDAKLELRRDPVVERPIRRLETQ